MHAQLWRAMLLRFLVASFLPAQCLWIGCIVHILPQKCCRSWLVQGRHAFHSHQHQANVAVRLPESGRMGILCMSQIAALNVNVTILVFV